MLTTGSRHRVRPEVTRYVSTFVLCGVMALFAGLASVDARTVQGDVFSASLNQTTIDQDWPAAPVIHAELTPADDRACEEKGNDADVRETKLARIADGTVTTGNQVLYTRIATLPAHAHGQWLRAP